VRQLTPYQFTAKLFLVAGLSRCQRDYCCEGSGKFSDIAVSAMMLRIAEQFAYRDHAIGLVTGDSLGQVASQNFAKYECGWSGGKLALYRPLAATISRTLSRWRE